MGIMKVSGPVLYLLDTNTVTYIVSGRSRVARAKMKELMDHSEIAISAISEGEMLYGLAKKPEATRLRAAVEAFLESVQILAWDSQAARAYGKLRASLAAAGKSLANLDMLIAAQAISAGATLVTSDRAFVHVEALRPTLDWAQDIQ